MDGGRNRHRALSQVRARERTTLRRNLCSRPRSPLEATAGEVRDGHQDHRRMTASLEPQPANLLAQLEAAGALSTTGLILTDPHMPIDQAEAIGLLLGRMHMSLRFAIGDWLIYIEHVYPEQASQLSEVLQLSEDGRKEYIRVSNQVPRSVRRPKLDWSHHRAVAALEYPEQKKWLKRAEDERMSHHALRDALRNGVPPKERASCPTCGRAY